MAPGPKTVDEAIDKIMSSERLTEAIRQAVKEAASQEFAKLMDQLEKQESRIMDLESAQQSQKKEIAKLNGLIEGYESRISRLENDTNNLEQYSKRNCILFFGVPKTKEEDTAQLICKIAREKFELT